MGLTNYSPTKKAFHEFRWQRFRYLLVENRGIPGDLFSGLSFVYFISLPCPTPWTPRPAPSFGLISPHNFFSQSVPFMLPHSRYSNEVHQAPLVPPLYPARGLPATVVSHLRGTIIASLLVSLLLPVPTPWHSHHLQKNCVIQNNTTNVRAGEMAHLVKCLQHKQRDLHLDPQYPHKKPDMS